VDGSPPEHRDFARVWQKAELDDIDSRAHLLGSGSFPPWAFI
jgi:hypothetical protein